jgi:hypothetical protein
MRCPKQLPPADTHREAHLVHKYFPEFLGQYQGPQSVLIFSGTPSIGEIPL